MIGNPRTWLVHRGNRPFTWLWWSQSVALFGSQVTLFAIPALAVFALGASPSQFALLTAVETLPYLIFSIPAGELADRVDRRRLIIAANLVRAGLLISLMVAGVAGVLTLPLLFAMALAVGTVSVVFDVGYQSYVPDLLDGDDLLRGNQRIELSESAARTAGPALAGSLVAALGGAVAVVLDAFAFLVSAILLLRAKRPERKYRAPVAPVDAAASPATEPGTSLDQMVDFAASLERRVADLERRLAPAARRERAGGSLLGVRLVLGDRVLRDLAVSNAIFNLASAAILATFFYYATANLGMRLGDLGLLMGGSNVGFIIGAVAVGAVTSRLGVGPTLIGSAVLTAIATVLLPFATGPGTVAFLFAGRFIGAVAIPLFNVNARALRQSRVPSEAQGRVIAFFRMLDWGTLPLGAGMAAWLGSAFSPHATLVASGVLGVVSAAWLVASPLRHVREAGGPAAAADADAVERRAAPTPSVSVPAPWRAPAAQFGERSVVGPAGSVAWPLTITGRIPTIRWAWLAIGGVALQLTLAIPVLSRVLGMNAPAVYVASSLLVLVCVVRNLAIPGLGIVALGGASNLAAIIANGGYMPVSPEAARAVGHSIASGYTNTVELANAALKPLTDIIVVPPPLPLANVYSVGDLLILIGLTVTLVSAMHGRAGQSAVAPQNASTPRVVPVPQ